MLDNKDYLLAENFLGASTGWKAGVPEPPASLLLTSCSLGR